MARGQDLRAVEQRSVGHAERLGHRMRHGVHPGHDQVRAARGLQRLVEREVDLLAQRVEHPPHQEHGTPDQLLAQVPDQGLDVGADLVELEAVSAHPAREHRGGADDDLVPVGVQPGTQRHQGLDVAPGSVAREQDPHRPAVFGRRA